MKVLREDARARQRLEQDRQSQTREGPALSSEEQFILSFPGQRACATLDFVTRVPSWVYVIIYQAPFGWKASEVSMYFHVKPRFTACICEVYEFPASPEVSH